MNYLKASTEVKCPHCQANIIFSVKQETPELVGVFSEEDVSQAREHLTEFVASLNISDEDKNITNMWINNKEIGITPADIDDIKNNIKSQYGITEEDTDK